MEQFRLGLSADFVKPDGTPSFPMFDLSPLDNDPRIDWSFVPVTDGRIAAADMAGFDALVLLGARFGADGFPGDGRLAMIARFGVGYDNVDEAGCDANDVALVITPSGVRRPVAVAIMTFVLALSGKLFVKDRLTREGPDGWAKRPQHMGRGLVGLTLGSLGLGNIGFELFRLATPFGMDSIAHDPFVPPESAAEIGVEMVGLDELFRRSDFLSVNCPLNERTEGIVNARLISLMKPTACLINTARGPIVDQSALADALRSGGIAGAGLDVFEREPADADDPILQLDNVIATPHSLCWTDQCYAEISAADVRTVMDLISGTAPDGIVNKSIVDSPRWREKLESFGRRFRAE